MNDQSEPMPDARIWAKGPAGMMQVGTRYRLPDGSLKVIWTSDPEAITGLIWVEDLGEDLSSANDAGVGPAR